MKTNQMSSEKVFREAILDVLRRLGRLSIEMAMQNENLLTRIADDLSERIRIQYLIDLGEKNSLGVTGLHFPDGISSALPPKTDLDDEVWDFTKQKPWNRGKFAFAHALYRLEYYPDGLACMYRSPEKRLEMRQGELVCIEVKDDGSEFVMMAGMCVSDEDRKAEDWTFCFDADADISKDRG